MRGKRLNKKLQLVRLMVTSLWIAMMALVVAQAVARMVAK